MALLSGETATTAATSFSMLPIARQLGLFIGLALSVALGVAVVTWSMGPSYRTLFSNLNSRDASSVLEVLQQSGIDYKLDKRHGTVMVASEDIHSARMKLANEGLPRGVGQGFEMLNKSSGFGSSQFLETARYRQALSGELARTISNFLFVKSARVHLAIPKSSSFIRDQSKPSASVFLDIYTGNQLSSTTVESIVNLVASSIPGMNTNDVTVVDNHGNLLTDGSGSSNITAANHLLKYRHQVEDSYVKKIQDILTPLLGVGKVKARVSADINFTSSEQTRESFNPDMPAIRSERTLMEKRGDANVASSVPGSVSNQPPSANGEKTVSGKAGSTPESSAAATLREATRNHELDKTISHTQQEAGRIRRLTVAVIIDDKTLVDSKSGEVSKKSLSDDEMKRIKKLVQHAVGYNEARGDSIDVVNSRFATPPPIEKVPEPELFQQGWIWSMAKQGLGGLFILILLFGFLMPILKSLASRPLPKQLIDESGGDPHAANVQGGAAGAVAVPTLQSMEEKMHAVKSMAGTDPKRVAQVLETWVDGS